MTVMLVATHLLQDDNESSYHRLTLSTEPVTKSFQLLDHLLDHPSKDVNRLIEILETDDLDLIIGALKDCQYHAIVIRNVMGFLDIAVKQLYRPIIRNGIDTTLDNLTARLLILGINPTVLEDVWIDDDGRFHGTDDHLYLKSLNGYNLRTCYGTGAVVPCLWRPATTAVATVSYPFLFTYRTEHTPSSDGARIRFIGQYGLAMFQEMESLYLISLDD